MQNYDVAVVIVGLNAHEFVRRCFASLASTEWRGYTKQLVYVDNGSTDGTASMVRRQFPTVHVIENDRNLGYCKAANRGARATNSQYLLFLNDDTEIEGAAIPTLIEYMESHPDVATAGARLIFPDGTEQWSGRRFPNFLSSFMGRRSWLAKVLPKVPTVRSYLCKDELLRGEPFECDWVSAAGQIFRTEDFWAVDGFAEDYYYWHEMVQCLRIKRRGRKVALVPAATIVHFEGQGSGPRPFHRQRFHIVDFHKGAFRAHLEHHNISVLHPRALIAGTALLARAVMLLMVWRVRTLCRALLYRARSLRGQQDSKNEQHVQARVRTNDPR
jgi:N-acetylglucosaminyl-diphospho-decaprenol L-rhamnosyltransferase